MQNGKLVLIVYIDIDLLYKSKDVAITFKEI